MIVSLVNNRFKTSRINAGYTQRDVQKILKYISFQELSHYEKGNRVPSNKVLYSLPRLYCVSLDYLLYLDNYRSHKEYVTNELGITEENIKLLKFSNTNIDFYSEFKKFLISIIKED